MRRDIALICVTLLGVLVVWYGMRSVTRTPAQAKLGVRPPTPLEQNLTPIVLLYVRSAEWFDRHVLHSP